MKWRIHKRVETKPDGRKIYYYTFEPCKADAPATAPATPEPAPTSTSNTNSQETVADTDGQAPAE